MGQLKFQGIRGMNDILPQSSALWGALEQELRQWLTQYGYLEIRTPMVEDTGLFVRSIGEVTDIVEKEMYSFEDRLNQDSLTLRPEGTASCVRSVIEHNLLYSGPQKLWYQGPMFRHERPQKGRYRQFHQCGVEALGFSGPDIDAEMILMTHRLWQRLGLKHVSLEINSIGSLETRQAYRSTLIEYFTAHQDKLDDDSKRRLHTNPLRILDSKNPELTQLIDNAPKLIDQLDDYSKTHFEQLKHLLDHAGIPYHINTRLVRGLDYYNATVFEWTTTLLGAQSTICGGGRYDKLVEQLGGKAAPACGFAMGIERLLALIEEEGNLTSLPTYPEVFVIHQGNGTLEVSFKLAELLRDLGIRVLTYCGDGNFKNQMKRADQSQAHYALIVGENELASGRYVFKPLRGQGEQQLFSEAELINFFNEK
ncbi:histidine--tRNA ligase [Ferrovum sp. PN-J185]|uniref:histidine--tRNA ligase n=1 Tax=Ferrovum sp. PN-J185 TaxID=1356306 RepID=UPI00079B905C|nr:histidine--tRNA ligase [Ferrovum sp. PN-J185]KXW55697.1 histidine--tRNA ligase [Ferrovum sp. PN-J185]MCC6068605.1 histidine--tRNA ligase [Ferrovum sp. PN-J185]MDE1892082.1 histidine--tRNA ligase [Betaproteobacteria bacterium]